MQINSPNLHTVVGNYYGSICSSLSLFKLTSGNNIPTIGKIYYYIDSEKRASDFEKNLSSFIERKKYDIKYEIITIPTLNELSFGSEKLILQVSSGDIIDLRPGSNIHCALFLEEIRSNLILISPITFCMVSPSSQTVQIIKFSNGGIVNAREHPIPVIGDLESALFELNGSISKKKIIEKQSIKRTDLLMKFTSSEGMNSNKTIEVLNSISADNQKSSNNSDNYGMNYEKIAQYFIEDYLSDNSKDYLDIIEFWSNIEFVSNQSRRVIREEDIICRIGTDILVFSLKFIKNEKNKNNVLDDEVKRLSGLFSNIVPKEKIHRFSVSPYPRYKGNDVSNHHVKEIKVSEIVGVLSSFFAKYKLN